jgi:LPXTG-site transpeptidase (sortase) family protein
VVRWPEPRYLLGAASYMTPDLTTRPACWATRGLARFIAGLALVAVVAACSQGDQNDVTPAASTPAATDSRAPVSTASQRVTEGAPGPTASQTERIEEPTTYRVRIPRIGVDAPVVAIQANENRVLDPPRDPSVVGWWSEGAAPGEARGSAVMVGHTVRNNGGGVFDDMGDLSRGDAIEVDGSASTLSYRVKSINVLSKEQIARNAEEIFAQTGPDRLVMITCDDWDGSAWRSNIVTIATPV